MNTFGSHDVAQCGATPHTAPPTARHQIRQITACHLNASIEVAFWLYTVTLYCILYAATQVVARQLT